MPSDETEAVSTEEFIGVVAVITVGMAAENSPAQARLKDRFGQTHYVMVEPENADETYSAGERVLIVRKAGAAFRVIDVGPLGDDIAN